MKKINTLFFILFLTFIPKKLVSLENKILIKIDNEIITTVDVFNEINYLTALNPSFLSLDDNEKYNIAINSLQRDRIKEIEILKNTSNLDIDEIFLAKLVENVYSQLNFKNLEDFEKHLINNQSNFDYFKNKLMVENIWNELIYVKFNNKVKINRDKLQKIILSNEKKELISLNLSEITFKIENTEDLNNKYELIKKDINEKGFENAAIIHSVSETSSKGGKIGWVNENAINNIVKKRINNLDINNFSEPIVIPGGFLIIKINDIKKEKLSEENIDKKVDELIKIETNQQLQNFSNIYFEKVKKNVIINVQ
jgi:peptidyl-prolyl cis-trans isomerase SurA